MTLRSLLRYVTLVIAMVALWSFLNGVDRLDAGLAGLSGAGATGRVAISMAAVSAREDARRRKMRDAKNGGNPPFNARQMRDKCETDVRQAAPSGIAARLSFATIEGELAPLDVADLPRVSLAAEAAEQVAVWIADGVTAADALEAMGRYPRGGWPDVFAAVMREISRMRK